MKKKILQKIQIILEKSLKTNKFFIFDSVVLSNKNHLKQNASSNFLKKYYVCNLKTTKNNTFITIYLLNEGNKSTTILTYSTGRNKLKQNISLAVLFGKILGEYIGLVLKKLQVTSLILRINGVSLFRKLFIKGLLKFKFHILFIEDTTSIPYNGCKFSRKQRSKKKSKKRD